MDKIDIERAKLASALRVSEENTKSLTKDLKLFGEELLTLKDSQEKNKGIIDRLNQENEKLLKKNQELGKTLHKNEEKYENSINQLNELKRSNKNMLLKC